MTRVAIELRPGLWRTAQLSPAEYGPVLTALSRSDGDRLRANQELLRQAPMLLGRLRYRRELAERWETPETTLQQGWGDCDNIGRTLAALGAARGYPATVWVGYPEGRSSGARHAIGVVDGLRGDLSGWSELWQAVRRGVARAAPKLREVESELQQALRSPYWRWALSAAIGVPIPPIGGRE